MREKQQRFYKLQAYDRRSTVWLRAFIVAYINVYLVGKLYATISAAMSQSMWDGIVETFSGKGITYAGVYTIVNLIQAAAAVICSASAPMLGKTGYVSIMVHLGSLVLGYPAVRIITGLADVSLPESYTGVYRWLYPAVIIFVILNACYFFKRSELFYKDTSELVTGVPEDIHKA